MNACQNILGQTMYTQSLTILMHSTQQQRPEQHDTLSIFNLSHWKREEGEIKWKGVYLFECSETGTMASKRLFHHTIANRLQLQAKG